MSNGWSPVEHVLRAGISIAASQTEAPISGEFRVTAGGAHEAMVIVIAGTAAGGAVDLKLQTAVNGNAWTDVKATTLTGAGVAYIRLLAEAAADQAVMPLLSKCRVVATTGGGESIVVDSLLVLQPL
jgi:hypothetical protein